MATIKKSPQNDIIEVGDILYYRAHEGSLYHDYPMIVCAVNKRPEFTTISARYYNQGSRYHETCDLILKDFITLEEIEACKTKRMSQ